MQHTPQPTHEIYEPAASSASTLAGDNVRGKTERTERQEPIIWTPPFIVSCFIIFTLGLGLASLLAYSWTNSGFIVPARLFLLYAGVTFLCWLIAIFFSRSAWVRIGSIGAALWALFNALYAYFQLHGIAANPLVIQQFHFATACSLFIASLALSYAQTRGSRWDTLLSWFIALLICAYLAFSFRHVPPANSHILYLEGKLNTLAMFLTIFVWWFRPANWQKQPGLTLAFGVSGLIIYALWRGAAITETTIFFQQVVFLLLILSALRIVQEGRSLRRYTASKTDTSVPQSQPAPSAAAEAAPTTDFAS
jgi:hypothetical protein